MTALNNAFQSVTEWEAFCQVANRPKYEATSAWVARVDAVVRRQAAVRDQLTTHYSTSGAEVNLAKVRDAIRSRIFVLRNQVRTNKLLGLMRLPLNKYDDPVAYHHLMREHAQEHGGRGGPQAMNRDRLGNPSLWAE